MVVTLLLETFPFPLMHGAIDTTGTERVNPRMLNPSEMMCSHYVAFTKQLETMGELLAERRDSRIVFVTTTTKWMVREYLSSPAAKRIPNLLVISDPQLQEVLFLVCHRNLHQTGAIYRVIQKSRTTGRNFSSNYDIDLRFKTFFLISRGKLF